ncbi:hypothetical protein ACFL43_01945 [Thermodesulfobacteriota bacterium]
MKKTKFYLSLFILLILTSMLFIPGHAGAQEKIGVLYITHGGYDVHSPQRAWDVSAQQFYYRPDHIVHRFILWKSGLWVGLLEDETARYYDIKGKFMWDRMGGTDPFHGITDQQAADLEAALNAQSCPDKTFVVEQAFWMAGDRIGNNPYPRNVYHPPPWTGAGTSDLTYCGEQETGSVVLDFHSGSSAFIPGATLTGSSGATALIEDAILSTGSWAGGDAAGTLILADLTYVNGTCSNSGSACTPSTSCGFLQACVGDYFAGGDTITDNGPGIGSATAAGNHHWPDCDPQRFNVDGPADRFIAEGVDRIIAIDMTVGGVRFYKTFDVIKNIELALADNGRSDIAVQWINDPTNLMENSFPTDPVGVAGRWTSDLGAVNIDPTVVLADNPNPIAEDIDLALLHVENVEASFSPAVADADTGVLILNHATRDLEQYYDPKINDTLVINNNMKTLLLARHPGMDPDNIIGAYMGIKEDGTAEGYSGIERTRNMRGENLGHAWLYEQPTGILPGDEWGYLYWDALELLKNQGVEHIVVAFPQIVSSSFYNLVEWPNQIAKEIGSKNWLKWGTFDYLNYPGVGQPFADYWGIWADTDCGGVPCCFEMGGCGDDVLRPYPPPRQTTSKRGFFDPSLAYDVSDYGHIGYDPGLGAPSTSEPVQSQYTGTWTMFLPPNTDTRLADLLAKHVLSEAGCPLPPTLINLAVFEAQPASGRVTLIWETASEIDNAGFNIYRAASENGQYTKINKSVFSAEGSPVEGAAYAFVDNDVQNRSTYYYKLEDIDANGASTMHGPVSATPRLLNGISN